MKPNRRCLVCGAPLTFGAHDGAKTTCGTADCAPSRTTRWRRSREARLQNIPTMPVEQVEQINAWFTANHHKESQ